MAERVKPEWTLLGSGFIRQETSGLIAERFRKNRPPIHETGSLSGGAANDPSESRVVASPVAPHHAAR
jgi:hypothetical protein